MRNEVREYLNYSFCRVPKLYRDVLRLTRYSNLEKLLFLSMLTRGQVLMDIGANKGYYTLLFSHIVGRNGWVHAFEPVPSTFKELRQRIDKYGIYQNVELNNIALGDQRGRSLIHIPDQDDGQASLKIHGFGSWNGATQIRTDECVISMLDDYVKEKSIRKIDFIKCDVEGAEMLVLKGGSESIFTMVPVIYIEICDEWCTTFGYHPADAIRMLQQFGYDRFFILDTSIRILDHPENHSLWNSQPGMSNILCTSQAIHARFIDSLNPLLD